MTNEQIYKKLYTLIKNDYGVSGLMGNLYAESGIRGDNLQNTFNKSLNMTDTEYTNAVDKNTYTKDKFIHDSAGYGIAQWTYWSRKKAMYEYVIESKKESIGDLSTQVDFLIKELKGNYPTIVKHLQEAKSVKEASDIVLTEFERPANQGDSVKNTRSKYSQEFYDKYAPKAPKTVTKYRVQSTSKYIQRYTAITKMIKIQDAGFDNARILKVGSKYVVTIGIYDNKDSANNIIKQVQSKKKYGLEVIEIEIEV